MPITLVARWCKSLASVAVTCFAVLAVAFVAALVILPRTGTAMSLNVLTGSMSPAISEGSLILIRPVDPRTVTAGDVITFRSETGAVVTHRVSGYVFGPGEALSFHTKGDANGGDDVGAVPARAVIGKVFYAVPHLGRLSAQLRTPAGLVMLLGVPLLLLVGLPQAMAKLRRGRSGPETSGAATPRTSAFLAGFAVTVAVGLFGSTLSPSTNATFTDSAVASRTVGAGIWAPDVEPAP